MRKITNEELSRVSADEFVAMKKNPIVVVADNIRSLNNIGSLFRTCDAFAAQALYLCGITATPPNKEIHKTALGAEMTVEWKFFAKTTDALAHLKAEGYHIIAIEQVEGAVMLDQFKVEDSARYAIVLGNEVNGVSQEVIDACDSAIEIPQLGTKHSLNVSVCGGVVIWELFKGFSK